MIGRPKVRRSAVRVCLEFIGPIPAAILIARCLVIGRLAEFWSGARAWLFDRIYPMGLTGVPYRFSWPWATVIFVQLIVPYVLLVGTARCYARNKRSANGSARR